MTISEANFSEFMNEALYGEEGFYIQGGGSGRQRDYMTSPEVGDLFGYVIAGYIDSWFNGIESETGIILEVGSGPGALISSVSRAGLKCAEKIQYRMVEVSPIHRETTLQKLESINPEFSWELYESIPECDSPTLVISNELLDNLVFDIGTTSQVYKSYTPDQMERFPNDCHAYLGQFSDIDSLKAANVSRDIGNFRIPIHVGIGDWFEELSEATNQVSDLSVLFFDYMKSVADMKNEDWLRLYSNNMRIVGVDNVIQALNSGQRGDITTDVTLEDLYVVLDGNGFSKIKHCSQKKWLEENGIDSYSKLISDKDILEEKQTLSTYDQLANLAKGDHASIQKNSFIQELETLTDETGLGSFTVLTARRQI